MADTRVRSPKATSLLKDDHRAVRKLFKDYEKAPGEDDGAKAEIFRRVRRELTIHAAIEEEIFYPALEEEGDDECRSLVDEAHEEHRIVRQLLDELSALDAEDPAFDAKMKVLSENVEHHASEEEREIFPCFDALSAERRENVSERLRARKLELAGDDDEEDLDA